MSLNLENIRREYKRETLNMSSLSKDPMVVFEKWLQEAINGEVNEPTAVIVGTVSPEGTPAMRCVLLKSVHDEKFIFYTNYDSRKGRHISNNPSISLSFIWHEFERQVHIEGVAEKVTPEESDAYFNTRPYTSRIGARISPQSQPIKSRFQLMRAFVKESSKFVGRDVARPENWGGYAVTPHRIEFWQGRSSRLHDRFLYQKQADGSWTVNRIAP